MHRPSPQVLAIVGATASGKSDLGVELALAVGGEVVNADSMQLYRGMDIGTAKLPVSARRGVAHHLLDVWDVRDPASVADYQQRARRVVDEILGRGAVPILVGGSGLYVRAVLEDLRFPGTDPVLRATLESELAARGAAALHARLAARAPDAAAAILATNGRRIVRALEVLELTGTFSGVLPGDLPAYYPSVRLGLQVPRAELDERIATRVERMWAAGLVSEVRGLDGLADGPTASRALGYAQALRLLAGELSDEQARAETVRATRRFARRQDSWFRREPVRWLRSDAPDLLAEALGAIG